MKNFSRNLSAIVIYQNYNTMKKDAEKRSLPRTVNSDFDKRAGDNMRKRVFSGSLPAVVNTDFDKRMFKNMRKRLFGW